MVAKSTPRGMEVIAQVAANDRGEGRPGADSRRCNKGGGRYFQGLVQSVTETGQPGRSDGAFLDDEAAPRPTVQEPRRPMTALGIPQIREFFRAESVMVHEERFPPPRLSAGCAFRKETIAGMRRDGRDAPTPAVRFHRSECGTKHYCGH